MQLDREIINTSNIDNMWKYLFVYEYYFVCSISLLITSTEVKQNRMDIAVKYKYTLHFRVKYAFYWRFLPANPLNIDGRWILASAACIFHTHSRIGVEILIFGGKIWDCEDLPNSYHTACLYIIDLFCSSNPKKNM